jgi:hypothetical protein
MQKRGANHWLSKKHNKDYKKRQNWIKTRQARGRSKPPHSGPTDAEPSQDSIPNPTQK